MVGFSEVIGIEGGMEGWGPFAEDQAIHASYTCVHAHTHTHTLERTCTHTVLSSTYFRGWGNKESIPVFTTSLPNGESVHISK